MASSSPSSVLTFKDLETHEQLGQGGCGTVFRAILKEPFKGITEVAVKNVSELREEEVTILEKLDHEHVVKLYGFIKQNPMKLIILEYAPCGTVHDYIKQHNNAPVPKDLLLKWLKESALALQYLHGNRVIHRDVKGSNCLLFFDHLLKLSDFGLAREIDESMTTSTAKGTWRYMAPEVNTSDHFSFWSDIYAYGMLGLNMVTGKEPFDGMQWQTVTFQVGENKLKPEIPANCSQPIANLLQRCWEYKPRDRPSTDTIVTNLLALEKAEDGSSIEEKVEEEVTEVVASASADDVRIQLFEDQLEVAIPALEGRNTMIIMRTGAGKTVVAGHVIEKVVNEAKNKNDCKVIFIVPTRNLAQQQTSRLKQHLRPKCNFKVIGIVGDTLKIPLIEELKVHNVIVLTAGILLEALHERDHAVELESLALLVFDECHHCMNDYIYNEIMRCYMRKKFDCQNPKLPQVVALTATTGTGKAKSHLAAKDHVFQLCANLDVQHISVVEINKNTLQERVPVPEQMIPICAGKRAEDPFKAEVYKIMIEIEDMIKKCAGAAKILLQTIPSDKRSQEYGRWLTSVDKESSQKIKDGDQLRIIRTCVKHIQEYYDALGINAEVRTKDAFNYLDAIYTERGQLERMGTFNTTDYKLERKFTSQRQRFEEMSRDPEYDNPLLTALEKTILKEYKEKENSRAILFCRFIETTKALKTWMEETDSLRFLQADRIVGGKNMPTAQQTEVLTGFREGKHKLLVATNVLEEGTDVAECNLVIRLNYIPSVTGHVQVKGRARAKNSKSYLIAGEDCNYTVWEHANEARVYMSQWAVDSLRSMPAEEFNEGIVALQKGDYETQKLKEAANSVTKPQYSGEFDLLCGTCRKYACSTADIGVYNDSQHIVCCEKFLTEKASVSKLPNPKAITNEFRRVGKVRCNSCGCGWGMFAYICDQPVAVIQIRAFIIERETFNGKKLTFTHIGKWTEAKKIFHVRVLEKDDLLSMKMEIPDF